MSCGWFAYRSNRRKPRNLKRRNWRDASFNHLRFVKKRGDKKLTLIWGTEIGKTTGLKKLAWRSEIKNQRRKGKALTCGKKLELS